MSAKPTSKVSGNSTIPATRKAIKPVFLNCQLLHQRLRLSGARIDKQLGYILAMVGSPQTSTATLAFDREENILRVKLEDIYRPPDPVQIYEMLVEEKISKELSESWIGNISIRTINYKAGRDQKIDLNSAEKLKALSVLKRQMKLLNHGISLELAWKIFPRIKLLIDNKITMLANG